MASRTHRTRQTRGCSSRARQVGSSSSRRHAPNISNVHKAPDPPKGQKPQFWINVVCREGKLWYRTHDEMKYFPDTPIDAGTLARDCPQIYLRCMDYRLTFLFEEALPCNLSMVLEFYANMKTKARSQVVTV